MHYIIMLASVELTSRDSDVIAYNFEYTFYKYSEIIKSLGLTSDFQKVLSYFRRRKMVKEKFDIKQLEHESDFRIVLTPENKKWLAQQEDSFKEWVTVENSFKTRIEKCKEEFDQRFRKWAEWQSKTRQKDYDMQYISDFDTANGINKSRAL